MTLLLALSSFSVLAQGNPNPPYGFPIPKPDPGTFKLIAASPAAPIFFEPDSVKYHEFILRNRNDEQWSVRIVRLKEVPIMRISGKWNIEAQSNGDIIVKPVGYATRPLKIYEANDSMRFSLMKQLGKLTEMEKYAALEGLKDTIEALLGEQHVPDSSELIALIGGDQAMFTTNARVVEMEGKYCYYYHYPLLHELLSKLVNK